MDPLELLIVFILGIFFQQFCLYLYRQIIGYKMILLGRSGSGKTTLYQALGMVTVQGILPTSNVIPEPTKRVKLDLMVGQHQKKSQQVTFRATVDVPGRSKVRWKKHIKGCDIIIYLINAYELRSNQDSKDEEKVSNSQIQEDLEDIYNWTKIKKMDKFLFKIRKFFRIRKKIFIVGNHFDQICQDYDKDNNYQKYLEEFKELIKPCSSQDKDYRQLATDIIIGSLKEGKDMRAMMGRVISNLK